MKPTLPFAIIACTYLLLAQPSEAAVLSPAPPPEIASSSPNVIGISNLGVPGIFWAIPIVEWQQTEEISITVSAIEMPGGFGLPTQHTIFFTGLNSTSDAWDQFEIDVDGPATFSFIPPPSITVPFNPLPQLSDDTIIFQGLQWSGISPDAGIGTSATISFGLDVVSPASGEPVVLTFRPISAPEPGSFILFVIGSVICFRRQSRSC